MPTHTELTGAQEAFWYVRRTWALSHALVSFVKLDAHVPSVLTVLILCLKKKRLLKNKTTIVNPYMCVCIYIHTYAERVRALCRDLSWLSRVCNQHYFSQCCWDRDFNVWIHN